MKEWTLVFISSDASCIFFALLVIFVNYAQIQDKIGAVTQPTSISHIPLLPYSSIQYWQQRFAPPSILLKFVLSLFHTHFVYILQHLDGIHQLTRRFAGVTKMWSKRLSMTDSNKSEVAAKVNPQSHKGSSRPAITPSFAYSMATTQGFKATAEK